MSDWEDDVPTATGGATGRGGNGSKACFKCGEEGHFPRECPTSNNGGATSNNGGGGDSRTCRKCLEEEYFAWKYDIPLVDGKDRPPMYIPEELDDSNPFDFSISSGINFDSHDNIPVKCNKEGHIARDCPSGGSGSGSSCRKRGEEGHFTRDCAKPSVDVPEELDDSNPFEFSINSGINFDSHDNIPVKVTSYVRVPDKIETFLGVGLRNFLLENIARAGYKRPTPIQKTALPILMAGHDVMGCAQTGSGKTAAFLIPILQFIIENNCESHGFEETAHPTAVIVSPTSELAIQIHQEAKKFSVGSVVKAHLLYGQYSSSHQAQRLQTGCHILVATPGRLLDFVEKGIVKFDRLHWLVLDEPEDMLDMGFRSDMEKMINHPSMPDKGERKTLMFGATFSKEVQELALRYLHNYVYIMVGAANTDVHQTVLEREDGQLMSDFYNSLESWLHQQVTKINSELSGKEKRKALVSLLEKETELLRQLENHRALRSARRRNQAMENFLQEAEENANDEEYSDQETDEQDTESVLASFRQEWKRELKSSSSFNNRDDSVGRSVTPSVTGSVTNSVTGSLAASRATRVRSSPARTDPALSSNCQTPPDDICSDVERQVMSGGDIGGPSPDDEEDWG